MATHAMTESPVTTITVLHNGKPVALADVIINGQSRTTDTEGKAAFDHLMGNSTTAEVIQDGKRFTAELTLRESEGVVTVKGSGTQLLTQKNGGNYTGVGLSTDKNQIIIAGLLIALAIAYFVYRKADKPHRKIMVAVIAFIMFIAFGTGIVYLGQLSSNRDITYQTQKSMAAENASIPTPRNIRMYPDDRMATVTWDAPANSNTSKIVGYYVRWGKKSLGVLTDAKQTIHTTTQIQPLENGVEYIVQVQSVQGTVESRSNGSSEGPDRYAVANGELSPPVQASATPSDARIVAMRQRLNGFFDDFNLPAGAFDEKKWNHASTACVELGQDGQFINSQFHAHNQTQSTCDRDGNISRPRAVFDITGRTEQDPGQIEFDLDGISQPRDVWYIDLIPTDARKNGIPLDVTSHNDLFDSDSEDPGRMIRIAQYADKIAFHYYDATNKPHTIPLNYSGSICEQWFGNDSVTLQACNNAGKQTNTFSPIPELISNDFRSIPNVRRHWVIQFSKDKIKLFIDGGLIAQATTPSLFSSIQKYVIHSTIFSYNTGKQFTTVRPSTAMLHWDNFGFNAPQGATPSLVTHNYIDGGRDGTVPMIARGTSSNPVPGGQRATKISIPDPIGSPVGKARLMFTLQPFGYSTYAWNASQHILINGKKYDFPNPRDNMQSPGSGDVAATYVAHADGIYIDPADLKQGMNDLSLNLGTDVMNVHIELDYLANAEPQYTQPKDIFTTLPYKDFIIPVMRTNDSYWFVEQNMGLTAGGAVTPVPTSITAPSSAPTSVPTLTTVPTLNPTSSQATSTPTRIPTRVPTSILTSIPTATFIPTRAPSSVPTSAPSPVSSTLIIYAAGTQGGNTYPTMKLNVTGPNGTIVKTWTQVAGDMSKRLFNTYTYTSATKIRPDQVKIRFINDFYNGGSDDRNLVVDKIVIDGITYETESPSVYSTGTWNSATGCAAGNKQSEWLHCNGSLQYK